MKLAISFMSVHDNHSKTEHITKLILQQESLIIEFVLIKFIVNKSLPRLFGYCMDHTANVITQID